MASSFYSNTLHVDFDSVLAMDNPGMVSVFNALMASGLEGFLGCPAVLYEADLVDFFNNGSVRDGLVVSSVNELSEIPRDNVDGLSELSEVPRDKVFYARSIVSLTGEPVGSLNAITMEKFFMLTAVVSDVRVNWSSVLFNILKKMVIAGSKQGKGFAVQISFLLENIPNLEFGKSSKFPSSKILTERTIHRYIVLNDKVGAQEATDVPKVKKAPRKRPAVTIADGPEAVPSQMIEPIPAAPAADDTFEQPAAEDEIPADQPTEEVTGDTVVEEEVAASVDVTAEEIRPTSADDVDLIIEQVIAETSQMGPAEEDPEVDASADGGQPDDTTEEKQWFDLPYEDIMAQMDADRPVVTPSDTDEEVETMDVGTDGGDQQVHIFVEEPEDVEISDDEQSLDERIDEDEAMSLEDILFSIPVDIPLPSAGVDEGDWYKASLPKIHPEEKGKEPLQLKYPAKGKPPQEHYSLICADIDLLVHLREQVIDEVAKFFYSFSLKKLAQLQINESYYEKEELVLSWAEAESTEVALQRKMYILLKYREVLELKQQTVAHDLRWNKTCCSQLFEGRSRTPSAAPATTNFVASRQRSYDDTLPPMSAFFKLMKKRWGYVCLEVAEFCVSRRLLPISVLPPRLAQMSLHFDDQDTATAFSLPASTLPSLPALTTELSTSLDDLRIFLSERFNNLAEATRKIDDAQSDVLSRLHTIKRDILAALMQQEETLRNIINTARQDGRTLDDAQTLRFNEYRKVVLAQSVSATADMLEVQKEIKALDAKVTSLDEQVAATRNDLLEFRAQAQHTLNIFTNQQSELVAYINRGGNDKKGEVSSSLPPPDDQNRGSGNTAIAFGKAASARSYSRPPPDDQNRGSGNTSGGGDTDRNIMERLITADRERERSKRNKSGSYKRRRY
ncbi:hypothetical protein F511_16122 [Dorcoceras hygrometricum]|uniref:Dystroglycan-like n=1 Tax=Dorcoceras hygrometricum TaxID=472368 RepID=A0A2Z7CVH7_9LAMI|nr:hypothetical protein F511_16122 [Dorcoceras hygrometricum]